MTSFKTLLSVSLLTFVMISCGSDEEYIPPDYDYSDDLYEEEEKVLTEVSWKEVTSGELVDGDLIIIEGYIGALGTMVYTYGDQMHFDLYPRRNQSNGFDIDVYAPAGDGPNKIHELQENYSPDDLKVVCDNGTQATTDDKIRIEGEVTSVYDNRLVMDLTKATLIEEDFDASIFEDAVELTDKIIQDTSIRNIYCYMDGKFELPMSIFSLGGDISLEFNQRNNSEIERVGVMVDDGPSEMDDVPNNYSPSDLKYRDYQGETLGRSNKVRVYGTWNRSEYSNDGSFKLEEIEKR